jgi:hypothetical protein
MLTRTLKIALLGLVVSGAAAGAAAPRVANTSVPIQAAPRPTRPTHRAPLIAGCFVPPPEPVVVAPCDDVGGPR